MITVLPTWLPVNVLRRGHVLKRFRQTGTYLKKGNTGRP